MDKTEAINFIKKNAQLALNRSYTLFSNINKAKKVWWLNVPESKLNIDLHMVLVADNDKLLILKIPKNTFQSLQHFKFRKDKRCVDLEICSDRDSPNYFRDIKSGGTRYDFSQYCQKQINIS